MRSRFLTRITVGDDGQGIGLLLGKMILLADASQVVSAVRAVALAGVATTGISDGRPGQHKGAEFSAHGGEVLARSELAARHRQVAARFPGLSPAARRRRQRSQSVDVPEQLIFPANSVSGAAVGRPLIIQHSR